MTSSDPSAPNSFALGHLALFATSAINDRVSVLAEVVLEASAATTEVASDLERLQLTCRFNDHLNLPAGRYHTGIGYDNAAFHHGSYFETTIGRRAFSRSRISAASSRFTRSASARAASCRDRDRRYGTSPKSATAAGGPTSTPKKGLDQNHAKSTSIGLSLRPERWRGAEIGASFSPDDIPGGANPVVDNQIFDAFGARGGPMTFRFFVMIRHSRVDVGAWRGAAVISNVARTAGIRFPG